MRTLLGLITFVAITAVSAHAEQATLPAPPFAALTNFNAFSGDGWGPGGGVLRLSDGTLWGTTSFGGKSDASICFLSCGTVYRLVPTTLGYTRQNVYAFGGPDGANPMGQLVQGQDGNIYGTTARGGENGTGTIFAIAPATGSFVLLYSFPPLVTGKPQTGGAFPYSGLVVDANLLFGTTSGGDVVGSPRGTIYVLDEITSIGRVLHWFQPVSPAQPAGEGSESNLLLGSDGRLYGTTVYGGPHGFGEIFQIQPSGANFTILHSFTGADGNSPRAPLVEFGGMVYGVTSGGAHTGGTIFRFVPNSTQFQSLYVFSNEQNPVSLTVASGTLFGTTFMGGGNGEGSIFRLNQNGTLTLWHSFSGSPVDGQAPAIGAPLVDLGNGYLVGTTAGGGSNASPIGIFYVFGCSTQPVCVGESVNGAGTVFEISSAMPALSPATRTAPKSGRKNVGSAGSLNRF